MAKLNYSNFELLQDIIGDLKFNFSENEAERLKKLEDIFLEVVGEKYSKFAKVSDISDDNNLTIICSDSFVANELYLNKSNILSAMREKITEHGIEIEIVDLNINYRRWK